MTPEFSITRSTETAAPQPCPILKTRKRSAIACKRALSESELTFSASPQRDMVGKATRRVSFEDKWEHRRSRWVASPTSRRKHIDCSMGIVRPSRRGSLLTDSSRQLDLNCTSTIYGHHISDILQDVIDQAEEFTANQ